MSGPAAHRHALALLGLLAANSPAAMGRGKLVGYLWPDVPESTARNRLNTLVHRLRQELGEEVVRSVSGGLLLNEAHLPSDLAVFRSQLEADGLEAAVAAYSGPFMDGFVLEGSVAFDHWLDTERQSLHRNCLEAVETLARRAAERSDSNEAVRWWREATRHAPFDSRITARLMEAMVEAGNPPGALDAARSHGERIRREFGIAPSTEVQELVRRLRHSPRPDDARSDPSALDPKGVAILPFDSLGNGEGAEVFAVGLHQDLLTRLSRSRGIRVISRTSMLKYRDRNSSVREIGEELGVGTVVEGSVRQAGERVRLSVQLVDVSDEAHRWGETYDRRLTPTDLFDIQSELAEKIAGGLRAALDAEERGRGTSQRWLPTEDLEAYRLCAQGRARLDERTEGGMRKAVDLFREAVERDPAYALAWVGLGDSLALLWEYGYEDEAILSEAEMAAHRAVELDPGLGEAHTSLGLIHEARYRGPEAVQAYTRAVELQPSYADAYNWLSWTNQNLGRAREAVEWSSKAVPLNPLAPEVVANLSITLLMTGNPDEALREARRARTLQPDETTAIFYEAMALQRLGRLDEARLLLTGLQVPWAGSGPQSTLAIVEIGMGKEGRARQILETLESDADWGGAGLVRGALGELDRAFECFARVTRFPYWPTLPLHHHFPDMLSGLRTDSRFPSLLGRVRQFWGLTAEGSFPTGQRV